MNHPSETNDTHLALTLRRHITALSGTPADFDALIERVGNARLVLLGEASHGTEDFYRARAEITKRLITEKDFTLIVVEADWPDAYRVNRYVRGESDDKDAEAALGDFRRFPRWMWRNHVVAAFVEWLREYNRDAGGASVGFYGMDLYSLSRSIEEVLSYLDRTDPEAARRARYRYSCFEDFGEDSQAYGYAATFGISEPCEQEVIQQLMELRQQAARTEGNTSTDEHFYAVQNARLVKNAEHYYRSMFGGRMLSWNLRDQHMAETLDALLAHFDVDGRESKAVVWAHNSHLGDARQTEMGRRGELNVGQLVRERYGDRALLVGFTTYSGTVTAATDWETPPRHRRVRPALPGSYEALFHAVGMDAFYLPFDQEPDSSLAELDVPRLERAIGVIYRPESERLSHYFHARLPRQFDAVFHCDTTRALEPLERSAEWVREEDAPETYPFAL